MRQICFLVLLSFVSFHFVMPSLLHKDACNAVCITACMMKMLNKAKNVKLIYELSLPTSSSFFLAYILSSSAIWYFPRQIYFHFFSRFVFIAYKFMCENDFTCLLLRHNEGKCHVHSITTWRGSAACCFFYRKCSINVRCF